MNDTWGSIYPREWHIGAPERISKEYFDGLRDGDPMHGSGRAYEFCKTKINGRWHVTSRQYQFGCPVFFAHPIVLICPAVVGV